MTYELVAVARCSCFLCSHQVRVQDIEGRDIEDDYDDYDEEDVDFEEDQHYRENRSPPPVRGLMVSADDLRRSLSRSAEVTQKQQQSEVEKVVAGNRAVMQLSPTLLRVPVYLKGANPEQPPVVVVEFNVAPPYPASTPGMKVICCESQVFPPRLTAIRWSRSRTGSVRRTVSCWLSG